MQVKGFVDTRVQYDGQELSMRSKLYCELRGVTTPLHLSV